MHHPRRPETRSFSHATLAVLVALAALLPGPVWAHEGAGAAGGLVPGVLHPVLGWDHVIAMVAVGLGAPAL